MGSLVRLEKKPVNKCRKWQLRVSLGINPKTGKYKTKTKRVTGTYTQAKKALQDFENQNYINSSIPFSEAVNLYIENRSQELAENTIREYRSILNNMSKQLHIEVNKVTSSMLEKARDNIAKGENPKNKKLSPNTMRIYKIVLVNFFDWCLKRGYTEENPAKKLSNIKAKPAEKKALKPDELKKFIKRLHPEHSREMALLFYASMGLRKSEALYLTWADIDLKNRTLTIPKSKTQAGLRVLPLPDVVFDGLRKRKTAQREALQFFNRKVTNETFVCDDGKGDFLSQNAIASWWQKVASSFGLEGFTLHELRHSYLTALAYSNTHPRIMQELAGHANMKTTMEVYTHINMTDKSNAVESFQKDLNL